MFQTLAWDALYVTTIEMLLFEHLRLLLTDLTDLTDEVDYDTFKLFIDAFDRACFTRCTGRCLVAFCTRFAQVCFEEADALRRQAQEAEQTLRARRDARDAEYSEADTDSDGE
jgi:hypothetical protein